MLVAVVVCFRLFSFYFRVSLTGFSASVSISVVLFLRFQDSTWGLLEFVLLPSVVLPLRVITVQVANESKEHDFEDALDVAMVTNGCLDTESCRGHQKNRPCVR